MIGIAVLVYDHIFNRCILWYSSHGSKLDQTLLPLNNHVVPAFFVLIYHQCVMETNMGYIWGRENDNLEKCLSKTVPTSPACHSPNSKDVFGSRPRDQVWCELAIRQTLVMWQGAKSKTGLLYSLAYKNFNLVVSIPIPIPIPISLFVPISIWFLIQLF